MGSAGMCKAWASWLDNATELRRQRILLQKLALRMRRLLIRALRQSFDVWLFQVHETLRLASECSLLFWGSMQNAVLRSCGIVIDIKCEKL